MQIFSLFLTAVLIATLVTAQELPDPGTLPGSWLYPLKLWVEDVGDWFTFGETRTINRLLDRTSLRLAEARGLLEIGDADLVSSTEKAYQDTWQEVWISLEEMEEPGPLAEQSVRLLMAHRQQIGSMRTDLPTAWMTILNGELRGIRLVFDKNMAEGDKLLSDVLTDRIRMLPEIPWNDILAIDPLIGLLRTKGEKKVIVMMMEALAVADDLPASDDRDRAAQHILQTIRGDLIRYSAVNPDDAVSLMKDLLDRRLMRVQTSITAESPQTVLRELGNLSVILGFIEEVARELFHPSRALAAESLKAVLDHYASRLKAIPSVGHEALIEDQQMRIAGIVQMLEGTPLREDIARSIPPDLLKMFPDLPWKIPLVQPGFAGHPTEYGAGEGSTSPTRVQKQSDIPDFENTLKSRLFPFLPAQEGPTIPMGADDPSARLQEMLRERRGTLSPVPIDLKIQAIPTVR